MKTYSHPSWRIALVSSAVLLLASGRAFADGVTAGTTVSNSATINYQVSGVGQTPVSSNTYQFVVDRKINLAVATTDVAAIQVASGSINQVLTFTVLNSGNDVQDFQLSAVAKTGGAGAFGGTDSVNAAAVAVYVESGATGGYQAAEDTVTFIDELAKDGTQTVYIVGDFSSGSYANGDIASYYLLAEARAGGSASTLGGALTETAGADTPLTVDIVFTDAAGPNDSARDARHSDDSDFTVAAANLTVTKSSAVISDPTNGTTDPKAIPGAVIEYTVTIANGSGAATATSVSFTDSLAAQIGAGSIAYSANGYAAGAGIRVTSPNINGGTPTNLTNAGSDDQGDFNVTAANTITVTGIQLAGGESATINFRVQVQ